MQTTSIANQTRPEYGFILVRILGGLLFFGSLFLLVQTAVTQPFAPGHPVVSSSTD